MSMKIDVDVALSEIPINQSPLVGTDGTTIDAGVTYDEAGLVLVWNFLTTAGVYTQTAVTPTDTEGAHDFVNQGNGMYTIEIPASAGTINNDTEGMGWFTGMATALRPFAGPIMIFRSAEINDLMIDVPAALTALKDQFDGTGVVGDTYPATQSQMSQITNVGAATNKAASSYTLTTGTQTDQTYEETEELGVLRHTHIDDGGTMSLFYEFLIGAGSPVSVLFTGYLTGLNDSLNVDCYDWISTTWKQIGTLAGISSANDEVNAYDLTVNMVGTNSDLGKVRIRFSNTGLSTATLAINQLLLAFNLATAGYEGGAIWIDTSVSNTNTIVGVDGIATNPVSTIAAANTLAVALNLNRFEVATGSTITFAASQEGQIFEGVQWTLALGGRSISGSHIFNANVSGICTGAIEPTFNNCHLTDTTIPPSHLSFCGLSGTITFGSAGDFAMDSCHSAGAGTSSPIVDFGASLAASNFGMRHYSGGLEIQYMGEGVGTYNMSIEGLGHLTINANCSATSNINIRGIFKITNNASGITIVADDSITTIDAILAMLDDDARAEPGQGAPPVNPDLATKIDYLYKFLRNVQETTVDTLSVYNDGGTVVDHAAPLSYLDGVATRGELITGA